MADEDLSNVDSLSDAQLDTAMERMRSGEDLAPKAAEPAPEVLDPIEDDEELDPVDVSVDGGEPAKQENVPFGRFERERQRRKEVETKAAAEIETLRQRDAQREERLLDIMARFAPQPVEPVAEEPLDPYQNPVEATARTAKDVADLRAMIESRNKADEATQAEQQMFNRSVQEFGNAAQQDPLVQSAYDALYASYKIEGEAYGLQGQELKTWLDKTEKSQMFYAMQNKIPLGTYVKGLAKARGWSGSAPQPAPSAVNDAMRAAMSDPANDGLAAIRAASASLSPSGGSPARTGQPSPQELLDMSPKQYDEWRSKNELGVAFRG